MWVGVTYVHIRCRLQPVSTYNFEWSFLFSFCDFYIVLKAAPLGSRICAYEGVVKVENIANTISRRKSKN